MTRPLGYHPMPERHTWWRSIVDFWRAALLIAFMIFVVIGGVFVQTVLMAASYYLGSFIHPLIGVLFLVATVFVTLPLLFYSVAGLIDRVDL